MTIENETVADLCNIIENRQLNLFESYPEMARRILSAHKREMDALRAELEYQKTRARRYKNGYLSVREHSEVDKMKSMVAAGYGEIKP